MKKYFYIGISLIILSLLVSCGGGGGSSGSSSSGSNTSLVTITVGNNVKTATLTIENKNLFAQAKRFLKDLIRPDTAIAAIPSSVYKLVFTISASDITTITKEVILSGQTTVTETFSIPNGSNRYFLIEAKDSSGNVQYKGSTYADLSGTPVTLDIAMTAADTTSPSVISTSPSSNETKVPVSTPITVTFSESVDSSTCNSSTFTLKNGTTNVTGTISVDGAVVTFTPSTNLKYSTSYTATVTTGVKDLNGNAMSSDYTWSFTTGSSDTTPPTVTAVSPGSGATDVAINSVITVTFSEAMDSSTISTSTFTLSSSSGSISGSVTYSGTTATFTPSSNLSYNTTYNATITTGVNDLAGNAMTSNYTWTFTTGSSPLVGTWCHADLNHHNNGLWETNAEKITLNSDGTGTSYLYNNIGGVPSTDSDSFTYTTTDNQDGSITLGITHSDGATSSVRLVISDDGKMAISDGTVDTTRQEMSVAIKIDASKTYTNADLSGDYYGIRYEHNSTYTAPPDGNGSYMASSSIVTFDGNGNHTHSGTANSDGTIWNNSGSRTYSVNSDGTFSAGAIPLIGCLSGDGKIAGGATAQSTYKWGFQGYMKKGDTTYSTAGGAGTWVMAGFGDSSGTSFNANFGILNCDSSGNCSYNFKNQKDGSTTYSSGSFTFTVSSDGSMTTSFTSGAPSYAVAVGNNGNTLIVNDSLDQSDPRQIYIGVRCSTCTNLNLSATKRKGK